MTDFYTNAPDAENPFGDESQAVPRTPGLREHLAAGHSITTFPHQIQTGHADIWAIVDRLIAKQKG